ncbi:MAG: YbjN domain-containing protein [Chloracidobacterium sp.]|nr:YbjN domain-containing protein [Chloracidobacterium validum]
MTTCNHFPRLVPTRLTSARLSLALSLLIGVPLVSLPTPAALRGPSQQAAVQQQEVFDTMTTTRVERILRSFSDVQWRELDNNAYLLQLNDGLKMRLVKRDKSLLLAAGWGGQRMTLNRINEWNRSKRFAKAYLDNDNDPVLESDYELTGGVTEQNVKEWMKTFVYFAKEFQKYMKE